MNFKFDESVYLRVQVYEQQDSLAAMACGLGGGSLVNAGVMIPTPVRARRNPKWPKEWEKDWEFFEASASAMLRAQSVPTKFPSAKVMEDIIGEEYEESVKTPLKLSVNFDVEDQPSNLKKSAEMGSCLACGNCLSGCPYNAKNSTDKNYIFSAIQVNPCPREKNMETGSIIMFPSDAGRMHYKNRMPSSVCGEKPR